MTQCGPFSLFMTNEAHNSSSNMAESALTSCLIGAKNMKSEEASLRVKEVIELKSSSSSIRNKTSGMIYSYKGIDLQRSIQTTKMAESFR